LNKLALLVDVLSKRFYMKSMNQYESKFIDKENFKNMNSSSLAKIPQGPIENLINNL
jgi:hypothetical protein